MSDRRDSKGRKLSLGESQEKDGRYRYKYTDVLGNRKSIYSWRLTETDPYPKGKHKDISLREKEKKIQRDLMDGIVPNGDNMTVMELTEQYISLKRGIEVNTQLSYQAVLNDLSKDPFSKMLVKNMNYSTGKRWMIRLQEENGLAFGTVKRTYSILKGAFQMAVDDDLIRKNPFSFSLISVLKDDRKERIVLTQKQQKDFLAFIKDSGKYKEYYEMVYILLYTGLRVSEFCGLTKNNIDFANKKITIDHQLSKASEYYIHKPKTKSGIRDVPMTDEVVDCFRQVLERRNVKIEPVIDGYGGFVFLNKTGAPLIRKNVESRFENMCKDYNEMTGENLYVTPHICRHTFCTNMAKSGINPAMLQYIMGHSDIKMTLGYYTHIAFDDVVSEINRIAE